MMGFVVSGSSRTQIIDTNGECGEEKRDAMTPFRCYAIALIVSLSLDANTSIESRSLNPARTTFPDEENQGVPFSPR